VEAAQPLSLYRPMKSRILLNLLLLLGIVVLGLIARFEPGIEAPPDTAAITAIKADDVHRIHINRPVRDDLVLVREAPKNWLIERPAPLPADDFKVRALTRLAEQRPVRSYAADKMDLAELQLAPPYASAILNDTAIEFGNLDPIDRLRYVRVQDRVYLIPDNYLQLMETGFSQFVRLQLFDPQARIESVRVPGLTVSHGGKDWSVEPQQAVSADALEQFFEIWRTASAISIQPANPELAGEPVEIHLHDNPEPIVLQIIARQPALVLARPDWGIQYRMGNRSEALLTLDAAKADIRD
jgi:hypothetical protein